MMRFDLHLFRFVGEQRTCKEEANFFVRNVVASAAQMMLLASSLFWGAVAVSAAAVVIHA